MEIITQHFRKVVLATLTCVAFAVCIAYFMERNSGLLHVYFLDVGQGDAIYIRTPNGRDMLIDSGPNRAVVQRLSEVMPWYDKSIDVALETHPDADHIGGFPQILERYKIGVFVEPGVESANAVDDEIRSLRAEKAVAGEIARRGIRIDFGDGAHFDILYPDTDPSKMETNDASIIGRLVYGSTSVMLTGDAPKSVENRLHMLDGERLASTILKAGHHGSKGSSGESFVRAVGPLFGVISAGRKNRYGHPHKEVMDILAAGRVEVSRTDMEGTIGFVSDGKAFFKE
ncbi:MAG TPA: MBL fold metallo-hydrolase [Candidatus Paceibacterota bacterium]